MSLDKKKTEFKENINDWEKSWKYEALINLYNSNTEKQVPSMLQDFMAPYITDLNLEAQGSIQVWNLCHN